MARNSRECPFSLPLPRLLTPGSTFRPFSVSIVSSSSSSSPAFQVSSFRLDASVRRTLYTGSTSSNEMRISNRYILNIVRFLEFVNARPFDVWDVRIRELFNSREVDPLWNESKIGISRKQSCGKVVTDCFILQLESNYRQLIKDFRDGFFNGLLNGSLIQSIQVNEDEIFGIYRSAHLKFILICFTSESSFLI